QRRPAARPGRRNRALGRDGRPPARRLRPRRLTVRRSAAVASLVPVERTLTVESPPPGLGHRARHALRRPANWIQLAKFCTVGAIGYAINLAVYKLLLDGAGLHYVVAATGSFLVAATNNYAWNRVWTFRQERGHVAYQGLRFLVVSALAYATNLA